MGPRARRPRSVPGGSKRGRQCKWEHRGGGGPHRARPNFPRPRCAALSCQWPYLTVLRAPSSDSSGAKRLRVLTAQDGAEWAEGGAAGRAAARPRPRPASSRPPPGAPGNCSAAPPLRGQTAATGRRCGHVDGGRAGPGGDPRGQGCGWGGKGPQGARVRKRGPSAVPAKSGPLPVLGCCSDWTPAHLPACCALPHFLATWSVYYRAWGTLLTTHSALGGMALGGCRVLPPGVSFPSPPCSEPAGWGLVPRSGTRSSVTHGSQCVSCVGVSATQR